MAGTALLALAALLVVVSACSDGPGPAARQASLSVTASGNGTVSLDGLVRHTPFQQVFAEGTVVTLGADPAPGHVFVAWDGDLNGQQNPVAVTMAGARTITAVFGEAPPNLHPLTVQVTGPGGATITSTPAGIACGATCQAAFPHGTVVSLEADPAAPSSVAWSGCDAATGGTCSVSVTSARTVTVAIEPLPTAPPNDGFEQRIDLTGASGTTAGSNVGASKEAGEPDHAGQPGGASVWWRWTAPASGPVAFSLTGAAFEAVVAAYTGDDMASLQPVPPPAPAAPSGGGEMAFEAAAGTAYHVAVDGVGGSQGSFTLAWDMAAEPPPPGGADLVATPGQLTIVGQRGGPAPASQPAVLANDGTVGTAFSLASNRGWLSATPASGSLDPGASAELAVTVAACTTVTSEAGTLTATGAGTTATVSVTRLCEGAEWRVAPANLTFVGLPGDPAPPAQTLALTNDGNVAAPFSVASDRAWITAAPSAGSVAAGASATLSIEVAACATDDLATGSLTVSGGGHARAVSVTRDCRTAPPSTSLTIERVYVNQAVPAQDTQQAPTNRLPLVADRAGLLRVFASASEAGTTGAQATLHYRHGGGAASTLALTGPASVPTSTSEATLDHSYDAILPAGLVRHGLQLYVELTAEAGGHSLSARYPASGYWTLGLAGVPDANMTLVPVTYNGTTPALGNGAAYLDFTERVFPLGQATVDIQVRQAIAFGGNLGTGNGWVALLNAITNLRVTDGSNRHYLGIVNPGYSSGIAGIAWVGGIPAAVAWSHLPSGSVVAAHELGHNWGLWHAPCGNPGNVDANFPYPDGGIGVWGYDLVTGLLRSPSTFKDLMGYCNPSWVSDYHYGKVMNYRQAFGYGVAGQAEGTQPLLIASGWLDGEDVRLEPLVVATGTPQPVADGPYRLVAWGTDGREVLRVAFDTHPVSVGGVRGFHLTLPAPAGPLAGVRIERDGRTLVDRSAPVRPAAAAPASVERIPDGRATVAWDTRAYAVAWVRDGVDGPLLAQDASGRVTVTPTAGRLTLLLSDGLNTSREVLDF